MNSSFLLDNQPARPWVFMDAGDTFIYGYPTFYEAVRDRWSAVGAEIGLDAVKHETNHFFANNPKAELTSQERFEAYFKSLYRHVLTELGFPGVIEDHVEGLWLEWESGHRLRLFDDARAALDMLTRARFKLGVISNWDLSMEPVIERLGVRDRFRVLVCSCKVGIAKPNHGVFEHALMKAGAAPTQAWYIGDQVEYDIAPAKALGMKTALVDYYGKIKDAQRGEADVYAPSLSLAVSEIMREELGGDEEKYTQNTA